MPSSLKRASEYGDDLQVVFVEVGRRDQDYMERFIYGKRWMGTPAMWTKEKPFPSGSRTIPTCVLLSAEGEVLLRGNPMRLKRQLDEAIEREIRGAAEVPGDLPRDLKGAWKDFRKGKYGRALTAIRKVTEAGGEGASQAETLGARILSRVESDLKDVRWCLANGYLVEADVQLDGLYKSLKDAPEAHPGLEELRGVLDGLPKEEVAAAKAVDRLLGKIHKGGLDDKIVRELQRLVKRHAGTRAAARAQHLARLAD